MYHVVTRESSLEDIKKAFDELNHKMSELEAQEPEEAHTSAYDAWEKQCEELAVRSETLMTWIDEKMTAGLQ